MTSSGRMATTRGCIAVLNAGSSSIKFALYEPGPDGALLFRGQVERIGQAPKLEAKNANGKMIAERNWFDGKLDHETATTEIIALGRELLHGLPVLAFGHRVVHGGTEFSGPVLIDDKVLARLAALVPLAPLHQPHNLAPIRAILRAAPHLPQVACFDTAFHRSQPALAQVFALPRDLTAAGVRRYGFHGLSYDHIITRLKETDPDLAQARLVIAHLGNGASLCAVHGGRSIASTMGFTTVDGLMMGTRSGAIDPGVLLYLMQEHGLSAANIEDLIYRRSGLLGVSGIASDMRTLRQSQAPEAAEAIALFVYRIIREIGSMAAALGGLDALIFTAGIGEHDAATRAEVVSGCAWLGLTLDKVRNQTGKGRISSESSRMSAWVMPTDEERMICRYTGKLVSSGHDQLSG